LGQTARIYGFDISDRSMPFSYTSPSSGWLTAITWVNFYPTFLGAGIRVMHRESGDYGIAVRMKLARFNLNAEAGAENSKGRQRALVRTHRTLPS